MPRCLTGLPVPKVPVRMDNGPDAKAVDSLLMQDKTPFLVAHRGYPARFPENSLEGMGAALESGARYLEFDIQVSADGVPVLAHDQSLKRTAGVDMEVSRTTFADLKQYGVGESGRFGDRFAHVRIPSLGEAIELLQGWPDARAFVEIKRSSLRRFGRQEVLAAVLDAIRPALAQCIVISFDRKLIEQVRRQGRCQSGWVMTSFDEGTYRQAVKLSPDYMFFNVGNLPADRSLGGESWAWAAYVVNEPDLALQLAARGIDYVETDAIGEMLEHPLLKHQGGQSDG